MSAERNVNRIVRSWIRAEEHESADRVLQTVLSRLDTTPQRRSWWPSRRFAHMNKYAQAAIAAAAVLIVAVVAYQFLPANSGVGTGPTPVPSATSAPLASTQSAAKQLPLTEYLAAGRYIVSSMPGVTVQGPEGWATCCTTDDVWVILKADAALLFEQVDGQSVYGDACNWADKPGEEPVGAEAFARALAAQPGRQATPPVAVTVGGHPAWRVRVVVPSDLAHTLDPDGNAVFTECSEGEYRSTGTAEGGARYHQLPGQTDEFYFLDFGSRTVSFDITYYPETPQTDVAILHSMIESIEID